jgi:hypothetical protein
MKDIISYTPWIYDEEKCKHIKLPVRKPSNKFNQKLNTNTKKVGVSND